MSRNPCAALDRARGARRVRLCCNVGLSFLALLISANGTTAQDLPGLRCGAAVHAGETQGFVPAPQGGLFCPLLADPKAEHSFLTVATGDFPTITEIENDTHLASIGVGDEFPLVRWGGPSDGDGLQIGLTGAVFAQFDLRSASFDLINADYLIGLPVTLRRSSFTARLRPYHQSSHLGDEFLLRDGPVMRENLSFESIEGILSQEIGPARAYAGGELLFRREPETLEELVVHGGLELRLGSVRGPHAVAAVDVKSTEQQEWDPAVSARGGLELFFWRDQGHPPRRIGILAEYYRGPSPYGQFFQNEISFIGVGVHFTP
jgi:hypothetical protein